MDAFCAEVVSVMLVYLFILYYPLYPKQKKTFLSYLHMEPWDLVALLVGAPKNRTSSPPTFFSGMCPCCVRF